MKKIAILGASGEIGARLTQSLLLDGRKPRAISRVLSPRLARWAELDFVPANLGDKNQLITALKGCDVVVNCAVDKSDSHDRYGIEERNIRGLENLLAACEHLNIHRLVHLSSIAVNPPRLTNDVVNSPYTYESPPSDWYASVKIKTEKFIRKQTRISETVIIRPGIVYGPYMLWSRLAFSRLESSTVVLPQLNRSCCHAIHIDDLVALMIHLSDRDNHSSELVWGVNPEAATWFDFFKAHEQALGTNRDRISYKSIGEIEEKNRNPRSSFKALLKDVYYHPAFPAWGQQIYQTLKRSNPALSVREDAFMLPQPKDDLLWPNSYETQLFSSDATFSNSETGSFDYQIPLKEGVFSAADWWNFDFEERK